MAVRMASVRKRGLRSCEIKLATLYLRNTDGSDEENGRCLQ